MTGAEWAALAVAAVGRRSAGEAHDNHSRERADLENSDAADDACDTRAERIFRNMIPATHMSASSVCASGPSPVIAPRLRTLTSVIAAAETGLRNIDVQPKRNAIAVQTPAAETPSCLQSAVCAPRAPPITSEPHTGGRRADDPREIGERDAAGLRRDDAGRLEDADDRS